ncbi:hypothetical protein VNI00_011474 [Paramarasmius palmivorus]|uniref:Uncharacterized protein n=1 Tax=Paramarasmius palmivorus TaxID=297713 RepID=A0AAW0CFV8_9AGAR
MSSNTATATATVIALIEYLTQPLTNSSYPLTTISILKSTLFTHFAYLLSSTPGTLAPFTLILSPHTLPPAPILAACMSSGISWVEWMNFITRMSGELNDNVLVFVMQGSIRLGQEVVWSAERMSLVAAEEAQSPMTNRLNTLLESVRARRQTTTSPSTTTPQFIDDSDSDSDTESTPSFAFSSDDDASSVSSAASSPAPTNFKVELPLLHEPVGASPKYRPPFRARTQPQNQRPRKQTQTQTQKQTQEKVTRYMYEGGQTGVITGGVMLGGASKSKKVQGQGQNQNTTTAKPIASSTWRRGANAPKGSDNNWRRRV